MSHPKTKRTNNQKMAYDKDDYKYRRFIVLVNRFIIGLAVLMLLPYLTILNGEFGLLGWIAIAFDVVVIICSLLILRKTVPLRDDMRLVKTSIGSLTRTLSFHGGELEPGQSVTFDFARDGMIMATKRSEGGWLVEVYTKSVGSSNPPTVDFAGILTEHQLSEPDNVRVPMAFSNNLCNLLNLITTVIVNQNDLLMLARELAWERDVKKVGELLTNGQEGSSAVEKFGSRHEM